MGAALVLSMAGKLATNKPQNWSQAFDIVLFASISTIVADFNADLGIGSMAFLLLHEFISGGGSQAFTDIVGGLNPKSKSAASTPTKAKGTQTTYTSSPGTLSV